MNKTLSKQIMKRTRLRSNILKNRTEESRKKTNFRVSPLRKIKQNYFSSLNEKNITDSKKF